MTLTLEGPTHDLDASNEGASIDPLDPPDLSAFAGLARAVVEYDITFAEAARMFQR